MASSIQGIHQHVPFNWFGLERRKQKRKMFPQSRRFNRPPHMNPGLLLDQGHKTPGLQKAKPYITLLSPSATQPFRPAALPTRSPVSPTSSIPPAKQTLRLSHPSSRTRALILHRPSHPLRPPPLSPTVTAHTHQAPLNRNHHPPSSLNIKHSL